MNANKLLPMIGAGIMTALIQGCGKQQEMANPVCAELATITNPAKKAELVKKCPELGGEFKQSPKQSY